MRKALVLALIVLSACGGSRKGSAGPRAKLDPGSARGAVKKLLEAQWATIAKPDIPGFVSFLSPDVVWLGSGAGEALVGEAAVMQDLERFFAGMLAADAVFAVKNRGLEIGVAPDGRAAWAADQVTLSISVGGDKIAVPYRVTSLVAEKDGKWWVIAQHWSVAMPDAAAHKTAVADDWAPLADLGDGVGPGAEALVRRAEDGIADASVWVSAFSSRKDAFAFGSAPAEVIAGGDAIRKHFTAQAAHLQLARQGGVRAALTPSGSAGFVAMNLDMIETAAGNQVRYPVRSLAVYLREGGEWRQVQAHLSHGQSPQ